MKSDDFKLLADIIGSTNGYLKEYLLSVVYPDATESQLDELRSKLNAMYPKLVAESEK